MCTDCVTPSQYRYSCEQNPKTFLLITQISEPFVHDYEFVDIYYVSPDSV